MNISNFADVSKLVKIRESCLEAIAEAKEFLEKSMEDKDSGGLEDFDTGYNCYLKKYRDGSGMGVDMTGCYVAPQMAEATIEVLEDRINEVEIRLSVFGVDV